jgi:hypothetical protein
LIQGGQRWRTSAILCAIAIALLVSLALPATAHAGFISIEWDPSPDPAVVGYRVSVGSAPGVYTQTFDVGRTTYFVYEASESRQYYLAVASYAAGRTGPNSAPLAAFPIGPPSGGGITETAFTDARAFYEALWRHTAAGNAVGRSVRAGETAGVVGRPFRDAAARGADTASFPSTVCWAAADCLAVRTIARRSAAITSIAVSADDQLFFIEGQQRISAIASGVLQPRPVLVPLSTKVHFEQVALDPAFSTTGVMYVGETETFADGSREYRIARYRVVRNQAGERAVIASIALPSSGRAQFSISSAGHVYVAMPAADQETAGTILRFAVDGSIPVDQAEGSVIAAGYARPTALAFDEQSQRLWLAGMDDQYRPSVASLGGSVVMPASMTVVSMSAAAAAGDRSLYLSSETGNLGKADVAPDGAISNHWQLTIGTSLVRAVAPSTSGDLIVAVATESAAGPVYAPTYSILRLTPR